MVQVILNTEISTQTLYRTLLLLPGDSISMSPSLSPDYCTTTPNNTNTWFRWTRKFSVPRFALSTDTFNRHSRTRKERKPQEINLMNFRTVHGSSLHNKNSGVFCSFSNHCQPPCPASRILADPNNTAWCFMPDVKHVWHTYSRSYLTRHFPNFFLPCTPYRERERESWTSFTVLPLYSVFMQAWTSGHGPLLISH